MKKFCQEQTKCKKDADSVFTCMAHMAEGKAFQCRYKTVDERLKQKYPCQDYKTQN